MTTDALAAFASNVQDTLPRIAENGRFGTRKVFVSAIWNALIDAGCTRLTFDGFKCQLIAAQRVGQLSLARADYVAAMPIASVMASEIQHQGATYHFVIDRNARDPWA